MIYLYFTLGVILFNGWRVEFQTSNLHRAQIIVINICKLISIFASVYFLVKGVRLI